MTFSELVGRAPQLGPGPGSDEQMVHGTTVLGLRCQEGIVLLADRRATMGNLIMYDQAEKIIALDDQTVVAISGAYARSIDVCRFLRHSFKFYERINLVRLSTEGKLMEISRALAENLPMAQAGGGMFLPIAATFDEDDQEFHIHFFDGAGARFENAEYACAGSGSERIRGIFELLRRTHGPFSERPMEDVLVDGLRMLDIAADLDSATGGFLKVPPMIAKLTAEGVEFLAEEEFKSLAGRALG